MNKPRLHCLAVVRASLRGRVLRTVLTGWALAMAAVAATAQVALADPAATASAGFQVRIIEGSKGPAAKVDPKLVDVRRELEALHHDFNTFSLLSEHGLRLHPGQRSTVQLPDGATLAIQLLELLAGPPLRVRHTVELPKSKSTRAVAPGGRTLDVRPMGSKIVIICTTIER
jgi:hypothetical protein